MKRLQIWPLIVCFLGMMLVSTSCTTALCEDWRYPNEEGKCSLDLQVGFSSVRTDIRDLSPFRVNVQGVLLSNSRVLKLADLPTISLAIDGDEVPFLQTQLAEDRKGVLVLRNPDRLSLGPLRARVTLADLPTVETDGLHRIFRSPKLKTTPSVTSMVLGSPKGRIAKFLRSAKVVWESDQRDAFPMHVVITEDAIPLDGIPRRWLGRYADAANGSGLIYAGPEPWLSLQAALNQTERALLGLIPNTVIIYDVSAQNKFRLSMLQPNQMNSNTLSPGEKTTVSETATAMATCSEEPVVMLAEGKQVSLFEVKQTGILGTVQQLGPVVLTSQGDAVIAARDVIATKFKLQGDDYFAVVWDSGSGKAILIKLVKDNGKVVAIKTITVSDVVKSKGLTAAALADLDSDGLQDLIVAQADNTLAYSPQLPDGSFEALIPLGVSVPEGVSSISVGDISGDSLPDVVVSCDDGKVRVFYNQP